MPRKQIPPNFEFPFHITGRCHDALPFSVPLNAAWTVFEDYLFLVSAEFRLDVLAFVLMPNHFHLLARTPKGNVSQAMRYLLTEFSREIGRMSGHQNQVFGNRHFKTIIREQHYFMNAYKYVYRNPVKARITEAAEQYPFSTLSGICGLSQLRIPIAEDTLLFNPSFDEKVLNWINRRPKIEDEMEIKRALRNRIFEFKPMRKNQKKSDLETRLY